MLFTDTVQALYPSSTDWKSKIKALTEHPTSHDFDTDCTRKQIPRWLIFFRRGVCLVGLSHQSKYIFKIQIQDISQWHQIARLLNISVPRQMFETTIIIIPSPFFKSLWPRLISQVRLKLNCYATDGCDTRQCSQKQLAIFRAILSVLFLNISVVKFLFIFPHSSFLWWKLMHS